MSDIKLNTNSDLSVLNYVLKFKVNVKYIKEK
jgi:hypothetical protein